MPLIRFSVQNFRSFLEKADLDMMPRGFKHNGDNPTVQPLKTAGIFGINASGKSNVISAISCLKKIVTDPTYAYKDPINNWNSDDPYTTFNITFSVNNYSYNYILKVFSFGDFSEHVLRRTLIPIPFEETLYCSKNGEQEWIPVLQHKHPVEDVLEHANNNKKLHAELNECLELIESGKEGLSRPEKDEDLNQKLKIIKKDLRNNTRFISKVFSNRDAYLPDLLKQSVESKYLSKTSKYDCKAMLVSIHNWFCSSIHTIGTDDFYYPLSNSKTIDTLSSVLQSLDVGIERLGWEIVNIDMNKKKIVSIKDESRLNRLQRISAAESTFVSTIVRSTMGLLKVDYWSGEKTLSKLVVYHEDSPKKPLDILSESDGTRRIVDLASILLPSNHDLVFLVDEIDRRMHPLITKHLLDMFKEYDDKGKQLIFSTHELHLLTDTSFDSDELWIVKKDGHTSKLISFDDCSTTPSGDVFDQCNSTQQSKESDATIIPRRNL